jgi:hypothetical protein
MTQEGHYASIISLEYCTYRHSHHKILHEILLRLKFLIIEKVTIDQKSQPYVL